MDENQPATTGNDAGRRFAEAAGWRDARIHEPPKGIILAACDALAAGLDSPALRDLAGMPYDSRALEIDILVATAMDELGLTRLHEVPAGFFLGPDGRPMPRPAADALQLAVSPAPEDVGDFQVNVFINGVDMAVRRGGLGLDPSSVLVPNNEFIATETPHTIAISRCGCGIEGCNDIEATIVRDGDVVHWEWNWLTEPPMPRGVTFDAAAYDAEVARFAADTSWETPERTAARLIWRDADHDALARRGLRCYWFGNDYRDASRFDIGLRYRDSHRCS